MSALCSKWPRDASIVIKVVYDDMALSNFGYGAPVVACVAETVSR
jgi:hypothetical protein